MDVPGPFARLEALGFELAFLSHARSILLGDFPDAVTELVSVLAAVDLPVSEIIGSGGGETKFTQRLRRSLADAGWRKHTFTITKKVDGIDRQSTSHEIDHVRRHEAGVIALEIEWNNKDPFFDRDLENFKRLHAEGAISAGVVVTRGASLQAKLENAVRRWSDERGVAGFDDLAASGYAPTKNQRDAVTKQTARANKPLVFADAWAANFVSSKFGAATTHWAKLMARVSRGVGNPCPLLLVGLPATMIRFDSAPVEPLPDDVGTDDAG